MYVYINIYICIYIYITPLFALSLSIVRSLALSLHLSPCLSLSLSLSRSLFLTFSISPCVSLSLSLSLSASRALLLSRSLSIILSLARLLSLKQLTPVGFEPTQLALVQLESTSLDYSSKVSMRFGRYGIYIYIYIYLSIRQKQKLKFVNRYGNGLLGAQLDHLQTGESEPWSQHPLRPAATSLNQPEPN